MTFEYLRQSLFFFRQHLITLAAIQLPFLALIGILGFILQGNMTGASGESAGSFLLLGLLQLGLLPLYWGATIFYMQSVLDGKPLSPMSAISLGMTCWGRLLLTYILNGLAVLLGLIALVIPGVIVGVRLAFADYICVLENKSATESLKQSWSQTQSYFWMLLQGFILIFLCLFLLEMLIQQLFGSTLIAVVLSLLVDFGGVMLTVFGFRVFSAMREGQ
ncbi:MAG: YciC family protein [Nitrincola lacisaponensis]|uniref:YciC family protein n=1 Tax=Nitrincola lacisaponensis TaxID=267850 RepID=UPI00391C9A97